MTRPLWGWCPRCMTQTGWTIAEGVRRCECGEER
jgi:hypothetical protein